VTYTAVTVARRPYGAPVGGWNPWATLRAREHIDFRLAPLPHGLGAVYWPRGRRVAIVIDPRLSRRERAAALAHELVHDERGGGCDALGMPETWAPVVAKDEQAVENTVARRFVPLDELDAYWRRREESDLPTTVADVAEEFDVAERVAEQAMLLLLKGEQV